MRPPATVMAKPPSDTNERPARRRRWWRAVSIALLVLGVAAGGMIGWSAHRDRQRERAIAELEKLGARIFYKSRPDLLRRLSDRMEQLTGYNPIFGHDAPYQANIDLDLSRKQVGDAELVHLTGLASLRTLLLGHTQVTDAGMAHLQGLSNLRQLWLYDTQITDAGAEFLVEALPGCRVYYSDDSGRPVARSGG